VVGQLHQCELKSRTFLLDVANQLGPIFQVEQAESDWICIVSIPLAKQLLRSHSQQLTLIHIELGSLFPKGFLRQMCPDQHRHYRKALVTALDLEHLETIRDQLILVVSSQLAKCVQQTDPGTLKQSLSHIATSMLLSHYFGVEPATQAAERLLNLYGLLGPTELVWEVGPAQRHAFTQIRRELESLDPLAGSASVMGTLRTSGQLDETMWGNLIYLLEIGRMDLAGLFRWLLKFAAQRPAMLTRLADESAFCEDFIRETLRLEQSERVIRRVQSDFVFQGYLFARGTNLRFCLWESHKLAENFPDPWQFNPDRCWQELRAVYSPFGLDHHHCPMADHSTKLASIFLQTVAREYQLTPCGNTESSRRGTYQWEPAEDFSVQFQPRCN
jgi:cytochrome P450